MPNKITLVILNENFKLREIDYTLNPETDEFDFKIISGENYIGVEYSYFILAVLFNGKKIGAKFLSGLENIAVRNSFFDVNALERSAFRVGLIKIEPSDFTDIDGNEINIWSGLTVSFPVSINNDFLINTSQGTSHNITVGIPQNTAYIDLRTNHFLLSTSSTPLNGIPPCYFNYSLSTDISDLTPKLLEDNLSGLLMGSAPSLQSGFLMFEFCGIYYLGKRKAGTNPPTCQIFVDFLTGTKSFWPNTVGENDTLRIEPIKGGYIKKLPSGVALITSDFETFVSKMPQIIAY